MPWSMPATAARDDRELGMLLEELLRKKTKIYWTKRSAKKAQNGRKSAQKGANGRKSKKRYLSILAMPGHPSFSTTDV